MGKPGRNDPCPCGSGKKYKDCCWPSLSRTQKQVSWDDSPADLSTWHKRIREWGYEPKLVSEDEFSEDEFLLEGESPDENSPAEKLQEIELACPHGRSCQSITLTCKTEGIWEWDESSESGDYCPICENEAKGLRPLCPSCGSELKNDPFVYGCGVCGRSFTCGERIPFKQIMPIKRREI